MRTYLLKISLFAAIIFSATTLVAQNYYWVGATGGNWSDLSNWSSTSGGAGGSFTTLPGSNARVRFDANSFSSAGQVVTFDVGSAEIKSMHWTTGADAPQFIGASANDSITLTGSMVLDPAMNYSFTGKYYFNGQSNDSLFTGGNQLLNDIIIGSFDTLRFDDNFSSTGGIYYNRGVLLLNNRTINCSFFRSTNGTTRNIDVSSTTFNLSAVDSVIHINPTNLSKTGTNEIFNSTYTGSDTVSIVFGSLLWNRLNISGQNVHFTRSCNLTTLQSTTLRLIRLNSSQTLQCTNMNVSGTCGSLVHLASFEAPAFTNNNGTAWNLDYYRLENITASLTGPAVADVANNSLDNGGNTNWTINETPPGAPYFWVGGKGSFYDPAHWATTSGGAPDACVPGPNDIAIFDALSGAVDTLFLDENIIIGELNFTDVPVACVVTGSAENIEVRSNLYGSANLQMDWNGEVKMTALSAALITSNGTIWNSDFVKTGVFGLIIADSFTTTGDFHHNQGPFSSNSQDFTVGSFYSNDGANTRGIDFGGSVINITGTAFDINSTSLTLNAIPSDLRFTNTSNQNTVFTAGLSEMYDTVRFQTATVLIKSSAVDYEFIDISAGSTVIFDNASVHTYDSIRAIGSCDGLITLKSTTSLGPAASLSRPNNVNTQIDYAIIDHLDADSVGVYFPDNSLVINNSAYWVQNTAPSTVIVDFGGGYTIGPGDTTTVVGLLPTIPAGMTITSSILTLTGVYTNGGTDVFDCAAELTGASNTAGAFYLPGPAGNANDLTFNVNSTTIAGVGGNVTLDLINDTLGPMGPHGDFIVGTAVLTVTYTNNYDPPGSTYYWHGDGGDWSDLSHWSTNSGNIPPAPVTCLPGARDTVIFDNNSFSVANQTVTVDQEFYFNKMDWSLSTNQPTLLMDQSLTSFGDIDLESGMTITRANTTSNLVFMPTAKHAIFDTDLAVVGVPVALLGADEQDTLRLANNLIMSDSVVFIVGGGVLFTNGYTIETGSFLIGSADPKEIYLDASSILLRNGFSDLSTGGLTFDAGVSNIIIDDNDEVFENFFRSTGHTFYNVTLNFNSENFSPFTGTNTFQSFTVGAGSKLRIENSTTQTISGDFTMMGTCRDSIYLESDLPGTQCTFVNIVDSLEAQCLDIVNCDLTATFPNNVTYFSSLASSTGWFVPPATSANAAIGSVTNYCFGDTLQFTNTSTAFQGDNSNLTFSWDFGDGSTHVGDTAQHEYLFPGNYQLELVAQYSNFCTDTVVTNVDILNPFVEISTSESDTTICAGDSIAFIGLAVPTTVNYQFFINGVGQGVAAAGNDTLGGTTFSDNDTITVMVFQNGCPATSDSIIVNVDPAPTPLLTTSPSTTICAGDSVVIDANGADQFQYFLNGSALTAFTTDSVIVTNLTNSDTIVAIGLLNTTGCENYSDSAIFTVNPLPVATLTESSTDFIICAGENVTFTASGAPSAVSYDFLVNGSIMASSASTTWSTTGLNNGDVVTAVVVNANGCRSLPSNSFTYLVNSLPTPTLTTTAGPTICSGQNVTFSSSGASLYQFLVNGVSVSGLPSGTAFYDYAGLTNGDIVTVQASINGCVGNSAPITYTVTDLPTVTLASNIGLTICGNEQPTITATSTLATNYEFFINGNSVQNGASSLFNPGAIPNNTIVSVITSYSGCNDNDAITFTVNSVPSPLLFSDDANNTICENETIVFTGTSGDSYTFVVNGVPEPPGTGTFTTSTLPAGMDTVYVIATNTATSCSGISDSLIVDVIALPIVSVNSSAIANTICAGEMVNFTATGAADEYQYFINSGSQGLPSASTTFSTAFLTDQDTVTVIAYNAGCPNPAMDTIITTVNPNPVASLTGGLPLFCEGTAVTYTAGTGTSYEFLVDAISQGVGASNTFDASTLLAGTHLIEVIVTENGCSSQASSSATVLDNPTIAFTGNSSVCSGEEVTFIGSGAGTYEYFVNGTSQGSSVSNLFTSTSLVDGDVVSLAGVSAAGCTAVNTPQVTMSVTPTPDVSLVSDDLDGLLCIPQTVTFTGSGATNYEFFVNGFSIGAPTSSNTYVTDSILNGQTISVIGEALGCIDTVVIGQTFTVSTYPVVNLTNLEDTVLCVGELTNLVGNGATDYQYYVNGAPAVTTQNMNITLNDGDVVTLEGATNTCATLAPEVYTFSVFDYPNTTLVSSDADNIICDGEQVTFTGSNAMTYEYFIDALSLGFNGNVLTTDQIQDGQTVSVIGYNADCPSAALQTFTFTVNTMDLSMTATPSNYMICDGDALTIDGAGADEYELFLNGVSQGTQSPVSTFVLSGLVDGDEITMNGYSNATGCTQLDDETVIAQVLEAPAITVEFNTTICEGDSTLLISNSLTGNQWYLDGAPIVGATDTMLTAYTAGDYSLEVTNGGNGEIWSVGYNANGEFGDGSNFNSNVPSVANSITAVSKVVSGYAHSLSLLGTGELYISGDNSSGQLGDGTFTSLNVMTQLAAVPAIQDMGAGNDFSVAVSTTGGVFSWGGNNDGQLGLNNTIVYNTPQLVVSPGVTNMMNVAVGASHTLLLKSDGTVWSAGNNDFGQLGQGSLTSQSVFTQVPGLTNIVSIVAGDYHSIAIDGAGDMYVWGDNSRGQLGLNDLNNRIDPTLSPLRDLKTASGGNAHTVFVTNNGRTYTTGANDFGQLATGDLVDRISPTQVVTINAVDEVGAGGFHSLFRKNDGSIWGAGRNDNYQLGDLAAGSISSAERIPNVEGVTYVDGGNQHSHFIYGNSNSCISPVTTMTVQVAPQPVLTLNGNELSTTATGVSYQWYIDGIEIIDSDSQSISLSEDGVYTVMVTYANGCSSLSDEFIFSLLGLEGLNVDVNVSVFPNPFTGQLNVKWEGLEFTEVYVTDLVGRRVQSKALTIYDTKTQLDLDHVLPGAYSVHLVNMLGIEQIVRVVKH